MRINETSVMLGDAASWITKDREGTAMSSSPYEPSFDGGRMLLRMRGRRNRQHNDAAARARDPAEWHAMVAEAAYYHAERRHFAPGRELDDWLQAEAEISRLLH